MRPARIQSSGNNTTTINMQNKMVQDEDTDDKVLQNRVHY